MTNGTRPFFQEVVDALVLNNHPDLVVLRDLCQAVDIDDRFAAKKALADLLKLAAAFLPLAGISSALFYELIARVLKRGFFDEFRQLMQWQRPGLDLTDTPEERLVSNWIRVLGHVPEPEPGLTSGEIIRAWKAEINCLRRAFEDLATREVPTFVEPNFPELEPSRGFGTAHPLPTLEEQLQKCVEHFFRNTHMLFQLMLERAVAQLERDRTTELLRILRRLHLDRAALLDEQAKLEARKMRRTVFMRIRITEIQDRRRPKEPHLYLDAFRPFKSRSIPISSFDRDEIGPLTDLPGLLGESHVLRNFQLQYYFDAYGEPSDAGNTMTADLQRRQDLIKSKHAGRLKLTSNDDLVLFLTNFFADTVKERKDAGDSFDDASAIAWVSILKFLVTYLGRMTAHTPFDIAEPPPNYLTRDFPRSLMGGLLHDCGVYAVRMAYILLSVSRRVDRLFPRTFEMHATWILLPLHVGVILESRTLALVVVHNQSLTVAANDQLLKAEMEWLDPMKMAPGEVDPTDLAGRQRKFIEDVAASFFNNDVDMPVLTFPVLTSAASAVTTKTIDRSYRRRVARNFNKLFSKLVGVRRAKQFQFDLRFLTVSGLQKRWFNHHVVPFWNVICKDIFEEFEARLGAIPPVDKNKYVAKLEAAVKTVEGAYDKEVRPEKDRLSKDLRADRRKLLRPGVRMVTAARLSKFSHAFDPVGQVKEHIDEVKLPAFILTQKPKFALPSEALIRVPE